MLVSWRQFSTPADKMFYSILLEYRIIVLIILEQIRTCMLIYCTCTYDTFLALLIVVCREATLVTFSHTESTSLQKLATKCPDCYWILRKPWVPAKHTMFFSSILLNAPNKWTLFADESCSLLRPVVCPLSDVSRPYHCPKSDKCGLELSTSIIHHIIRCEGYVVGQQGRVLFQSRLLGLRESQKARMSWPSCVRNEDVFLGWCHLHLWPRLHARDEGRGAHLVVEIFSADSLYYSPPKGSTALHGWAGWLVHNAYLMDTSALKPTNVNLVMWEEFNTDTVDAPINHFPYLSLM